MPFEENDLVWDIYGDSKMGRMKHGGPITSIYNLKRGFGGNAENGVGQMWTAEGAPWNRWSFRAKDDVEAAEKIMNVDIPASVHGYIDQYKQAMVDLGREAEIEPPEGDEAEASATTNFKLEDDLPPEAVETMRKAFESKDQAAMAEAMAGLNEYDPKDRSFDDRIKFWDRQFQKAWKPEFEKDHKEAKSFVQDSLTPYMPGDYTEMLKMERKKQAQEALEAHKLAAAEMGKEQKLDFTDSVCSIVQTKSCYTDWEKTAVYGAHPGVYFGCHCAATWEFMEWKSHLQAAFIDKYGVDHKKRYPMSKGRKYEPEEDWEDVQPGMIMSKLDYSQEMKDLDEERTICKKNGDYDRIEQIDLWMKHLTEETGGIDLVAGMPGAPPSWWYKQ